MDKIQDTMFLASRTRTKRGIAKFDIDLSSGLADVLLRSPGTMVYLDRSSTGYVYVELNEEQGGALDPIAMVAGDSVECPFNVLKLNAPAQAGKVLRLMVCNGVSIRGGTGMSTGSGGIATSVTNFPGGVSYGASYKSTTNMAANTPDTVFTPAANVNGAIIWGASFATAVAGSMSVGAAFIAKASAPASVVDGDVIVSLTRGAGGNGMFACGDLVQATRVAAGKGLYYLAATAESNAQREVLYTLL